MSGMSDDEKKNIEDNERKIRGDGNTGIVPVSVGKEHLQRIKYFFTYNNWKTETTIERFERSLKVICKKYIFQEEIGDSGTNHLQGCFWLKTGKRKRITELKKLLGNKIWFAVVRSWLHSIKYCSKTETRIGLTYLLDVIIPRPIKVLDPLNFYDWEKEIIEIINKEPDDRSIYWYWEKIGCAGKSTFCKYLCVKKDALILSGKSSDMKYGVVKYYEKHKTYPRLIILDIPRTCEGYISFKGIEEIKNACFFSSKYECDMIVGNCPHIIIFANFYPETSKVSKDRWKIKCIGVSDEILSDC